jgi:hypothetical protein
MLTIKYKHFRHVQIGTKQYSIVWNGTESRNPKINVVVPMLFVGAFHRIALEDKYCK